MNIAKAWACGLGAFVVCGTLSGMVVLYGPPSQSPDDLVVQAVFGYGPALLTMVAATLPAYLIARHVTEDQWERLIAGYGVPALAIVILAVYLLGTGMAGVSVVLTAVAVGAAGSVLGGALAEQLYRKRRRTRADWY